VDKVRPNEVASSKGAKEGKLTCHNGSSYDASKLLCILTWHSRMRALYT
jgi:hypothetical protein